MHIYAICLTHLSLASNKRDIGKKCRPRSDAAEHGVWSGSTLFALSSEVSSKHDNNKNLPDTPCIGSGLVQRVKVEESIRDKISDLQTKIDICANSVDPDETVTRSLIRTYTICRTVFDLRLCSLFASVDMSKFKDGTDPLRNTGMFFCVVVYGPVNPMGSCRARSVYLTTRLLGRLSPLSGLPVLCTFFRQKLTTALLESAEGREWP